VKAADSPGAQANRASPTLLLILQELHPGSVTGLPLPNRALQGTYFVNPDCSGTLALNIPGLPFSIVYDIVVVSHGREFHSIVASPQPVMVLTTGQKVR
jgi:hypothetical protein